MKDPGSLFVKLFLLIGSCAMLSPTGCQRTKSVLSGDSTSQSQIETLYPNTPAGQRVKEHMSASMTFGEDPGPADVLLETYRKIPAKNYLLRTMLIEGLKELRSPAALAHLNDIARAKIPEDQSPEDTEVDTRTDEL